MKMNDLYKLVENYLINHSEKLKINSKDIIKGDIFVALQGSKVHGNIYVQNAIKKGAKYIISEKKDDLFSKYINILIVDDALLFLLSVANNKRTQFKGKIIGVTGSAGKTSVKENLKYFLSGEAIVSASIKSYNNYLGVIISIINLDLSSDFAIFEIGTNNFNEIRSLTSLIMPSQVIITNILPTHLENFKNTRNIAIEKSDIFNSKFNSNVELLVLPQNNEDEIYIKDLAEIHNIPNIITLGDNAKQNFNLEMIQELESNFSLIRITSKKNVYEFKVNTNLHHRICNIIICFIIFNYNNLNISTFISLAKNIPEIEGRGFIKKIYLKKKIINFIDESYNANPITMKICIDYFSKINIVNDQQKFLILGDMNELGEFSNEFHKEILQYIIDQNFSNVIICGELFYSAMKKLKIKGSSIRFMLDEMEIIHYLEEFLHNNDTILIKGSNSTRVNKLGKILLGLKGVS